MNGGGGYNSPGNIEAMNNMNINHSMDAEEETWKSQGEPQPQQWKQPEIEDEEVGPLIAQRYIQLPLSIINLLEKNTKL